MEKSQWHRFRKYVRHMNSKSRGKESYKVLFIGRHGQGWHNIAETKYDTTAWDGYWSMLDGADGITWADAKLTELGESQAKKAGDLWKNLLPKGIPVPETYYVSPLTRALQTADLTFKTLDLPKDRPYNPIVKEVGPSLALFTGHKLTCLATTRSYWRSHLQPTQYRFLHPSNISTCQV